MCPARRSGIGEESKQAGRSSSRNPRLKAATSYDVARLAGVSQSAVSRCFTDRGGISSETRKKILQAVQELDYRPNAIAQSLINQHSNLVAIIVANFDFYPALTAHLSIQLNKRGMQVMLFTLEQESDSDHILDQIWQYRVAGVIAAVHLSPKHIASLSDSKTPIIFFNRNYDNLEVNAVCCDQMAGERTLVDRLVGAGHKSFGILKGPVDSVVSGQRVAGAIERLHQLDLDDLVLVEGDFTYDSGKRGLAALVNMRGGCPDAIVCANDLMAFGALDSARHDLDIDVPAHLSIVGFDGLVQARWSSYDLTTMRQPIEAMVHAAVDMLMVRIADPVLPKEKRMFFGELIPGGSARLS